MKRKIFTTMLLLCSVVVCIAAVISGLDGKWMATLKPGDGSEIQVAYTFKVDGDKFTGDVAFPQDDFPMTDGVIKGDSISFNVEFNGNKIPNHGRLYADSIALDIVMNDVKHHNVLKRADK
jgi:hypothetical protein